LIADSSIGRMIEPVNTPFTAFHRRILSGMGITKKQQHS
jgi:hypothetical protein